MFHLLRLFVFLFAFIFISAIVRYVSAIYRKINRQRYRRITEFAEAVEFLKTTNLTSRARANAHLRAALDIMNPFVASSETFHDEYVKRIRQRLSQVEWQAIVLCAQTMMTRVPEMKTVKDVRRCVRAVVMNIAMTIFGVTGYDYNDLLQIGALINALWLAAKEPQFDTTGLREELYSILKQFQVSEFIEEIANISDVSVERAILSVLIPAYETMYRVALPVLFHSKEVSFERFLSPQSSISTLNSTTEIGHSYISLIRETLRLYPVVKKIKRDTSTEKLAVDIEGIQHGRTWVDPLEFRPERWSDGEVGGYMPFGAGIGRCIANEYLVGRIVCIALAVITPHLPQLSDEEGKILLQNDRGQG